MTKWYIYVDGACSGNPGDAGAGVVVLDGESRELFRESVYLGHMTNNMAEYEALLIGLKKAEASSVEDLTVYTDSLLVANQVKGGYKINNARLKQYVEEAARIILSFKAFRLNYIPREQNRLADKLAKDGVNKKG
jgi:ribonuclease HI